MDEYIKRDYVNQIIFHYASGQEDKTKDLLASIEQSIYALPNADVTEEENILKFYYVRSIDDYWLGRRVDNFYYAEYLPEIGNWVWTHSRNLLWGEHVVEPNTLWKEHTYPSEPEEIPFHEWLTGFMEKYVEIDVSDGKVGKWIHLGGDEWCCSSCGYVISTEGSWEHPIDTDALYCKHCGAKMEER